MTVATIDEANVVLYGEPLDEFVRARNDLVKEVRAAGDRELANEIKTLRKPSVIAAGLNGVVRGDGEGVETMLAAADALREGQQAMVAGDEIDVAALQQAYRDALQALAQQATTNRLEVRAALEAAAANAEHHHELRKGTFVTVPAATGGFDFLTPGLSVVSPPKKPPKARAKRKPPAEPEVEAEAEARAKAARLERLRETERDAAEAAKQASAAARRAEAARRRAEKRVATVSGQLEALEAKLADKREELAAAEDALEAAESGAQFASKRSAQADTDLNAAKAAVAAENTSDKS